jgi:hypothetical protein
MFDLLYRWLTYRRRQRIRRRLFQMCNVLND